ncbi:hypothetical protein K435DRAFT_859436 [Dendrothele bispora CBS 962.96]|uniref:Uncharacterized protein n=1 Tax=Dendrothele bispora (strain CBS 962.96) TaxID=1314807 RepID=A0A4S8M0K2_DENBC|nr:hypothetical protein K435DRAFT_859436 [Dendrothele bispora CBS 962.96]
MKHRGDTGVKIDVITEALSSAQPHSATFRIDATNYLVCESVITPEALAGCPYFPLTNDTTCAQGRVPLYAVNVSSIHDLVESGKSASQNNLNLVFKNTGDWTSLWRWCTRTLHTLTGNNDRRVRKYRSKLQTVIKSESVKRREIALFDAGWGGVRPFVQQTLSLTFAAQGTLPTQPEALSTMDAFFTEARNITGVAVAVASYHNYSSFDNSRTKTSSISKTPSGSALPLLSFLVKFRASLLGCCQERAHCGGECRSAGQNHG